MKNTLKQTAYERVKKWRENNKEKHKLQWERYYLKNRDLVLERKRNKYKLNKEYD